MKTTLDLKSLRPVLSALKKANAKTLSLYPGESAARQPVHTVYGGAHLYKADAGRKLGQLALKNLHQFAPEAAGFAEVLGVPQTLARTLYDRVVDKLTREAVEDFRIDFEDGYGNRPDEEEDHHAVAAADEG